MSIAFLIFTLSFLFILIPLGPFLEDEKDRVASSSSSSNNESIVVVADDDDNVEDVDVIVVVVVAVVVVNVVSWEESNESKMDGDVSLVSIGDVSDGDSFDDELIRRFLWRLPILGDLRRRRF